MLRYLGRHFRGQQPLALCFWANFLVPACLLYPAGTMLRDQAAADTRFLAWLLAFLAAYVLIWAWQVTGVWRAAERALQEHAWFLWARGAQMVAVLSVLLVLGQAWGYVHLSVQKDPPDAAPGRVPAYVLDLSPDGTVVRMRGEIDFGITRDLAGLLRDHSMIRIVELDSPGGLVSEARGLSSLIVRHGLATYVQGTCSSACTHVYVSGEQRLLGPGSRLGFHSYRLDTPHAAIFMDPVAEQRSDLAFFRSRKVDPGFLERVLNTPHDAIWFPSHDELLDAGIAHEVGALR